MIEFLMQYIAPLETKEKKANKLREILQLLCLKIMQDRKYFSNIAFVGGTALRVLYDMKRFSEDLDFSVINKERYDFSEITSTLKREFKLYGLELEAKSKSAKTVQSSMLKFPNLLKNMGISEFKNQKLSIKLEIDSNPPAGWRIESTVVNKTYLLNIVHFDLPSLYSTKIHACFFRKYAKGRDFYDFLWYLGKKIEPNYKLLNNAIKQTEGKSPELSEGNIEEFMLDRIANINFNRVKKDVEKFLEDKNELELINASVISKSVRDVFGK